MRSAFPAGIMLGLALLLGGCASLDPVGLPQTEADLEMKGRVAFRYGSEGGSASVNWRHAPTFDDMLITGPLGQGIARLTRANQSFTLTTVDGKVYREPDAESLTEAVLGWRLPLAGLPDWVRGRPVAERPAQVDKDGNGQVLVIVQDDWRIEYQTWNGANPARMSLRRQADQSRSAIDLRLIIDELGIAR